MVFLPYIYLRVFIFSKTHLRKRRFVITNDVLQAHVLCLHRRSLRRCASPPSRLRASPSLRRPRPSHLQWPRRTYLLWGAEVTAVAAVGVPRRTMCLRRRHVRPPRKSRHPGPRLKSRRIPCCHCPRHHLSAGKPRTNLSSHSRIVRSFYSTYYVPTMYTLGIVPPPPLSSF